MQVPGALLGPFPRPGRRQAVVLGAQTPVLGDDADLPATRAKLAPHWFPYVLLTVCSAAFPTDYDEQIGWGWNPRVGAQSGNWLKRPSPGPRTDV